MIPAKCYVLDASVRVAAAVAAEQNHRLARELLEVSDVFIVPAVFRLEVAAALLRRGASAGVVDAVQADCAGARYDTADIDAALIDRAIRVAYRCKLRAYDALYVALADLHGAALVTLDAEVADRVRAHWPGVDVVG